MQERSDGADGVEVTSAEPAPDGPLGGRITLSKADLADAFDAFAQDVYRYCVKTTGDRVLAEDLMSVVFLEAWRSRERAVLVDATLRPWLLGIAANVVRNSRRSQRRHAAMLTAFHAADDRTTQPDHADAVVAAVDAPANRRVLNDALAQLSERDRAVAETCLVEGHRAAVAAVDLGLTEAAVKSRLGRARAHLRRLLQPGEPAASTSRSVRTGHLPGERHLDAPAGGPHPQETRS